VSRPDVARTAIPASDPGELNVGLAALLANALIPLGAVFAFAQADREIAADPSLLIKNSKMQTLPPDPVELDGVDAVLAHMATACDPQS
jgi:hypothetical protein